MTGWRKRQILDMAQQCGLIGMRPYLDGIYCKSIEAFAKLVREDEREACAKVCEDYGRLEEMQAIGNDCAAAIRARGQS